MSLFTHLIMASVAAAAVWTFQDARMDATVADARLAGMEEKLQAQTQGRANERAISKTYIEALNVARTREAALHTDLRHLHAVSDSLREQNANTARQLAAAPPAAVLEYAAALGTVFDDCRAAYAGMVEKADGHASDVRTITQAWPVITAAPTRLP
ncbi:MULTISPECIES: hypothetical protein [Giesbergeria]|uniref:Uncharacterized protein n=1 Tax=Giesbergeria sinuosa TaxID=80883 RepID=A0ABV9QFU4_9BURK